VGRSASEKFIAFQSTFMMMSNAGGQALEAHNGIPIDQCVKLCAQDPGCKAFDAGNTAAIDNTQQTFQAGNCFLSYDNEMTIKERDVRQVSQLMLYRKVDAPEVRNVWFRKRVDAYIRGSDSGGVYFNEHSPEACAQLCLDDVSCKAFDAGRPFYAEKSYTTKKWQPHIDNCFLSYKTWNEVPGNDRVNAVCKKDKNKSQLTSDQNPLDKGRWRAGVLPARVVCSAEPPCAGPFLSAVAARRGRAAHLRLLAPLPLAWPRNF